MGISVNPTNGFERSMELLVRLTGLRWEHKRCRDEDLMGPSAKSMWLYDMFSCIAYDLTTIQLYLSSLNGSLVSRYTCYILTCPAVQTTLSFCREDLDRAKHKNRYRHVDVDTSKQHYLSWIEKIVRIYGPLDRPHKFYSSLPQFADEILLLSDTNAMFSRT